MKTLLITIIFPTVLFVTGCSLLQPHSIDVQQGNIISQERVNRLQPGMNKKQVLFVMGSPIIEDPFHHNRWDYVYTMERQHKLESNRKMTLVFQDDRLVSIEGDLQPQAQSDQRASGSRSEVITITPKQEKVGIFSSMMNVFSDDDDEAQPAEASQPEPDTDEQDASTP